MYIAKKETWSTLLDLLRYDTCWYYPGMYCMPSAAVKVLLLHNFAVGTTGNKGKSWTNQFMVFLIACIPQSMYVYSPNVGSRSFVAMLPVPVTR